jgi:hypothetical protein
VAAPSQRITLESCYDQARVEVREAPLGPQGREAFIAPAEDALRVTINSDLLSRMPSPTIRRQRSRFRIAHELGHTFFYLRRARRAVRRSPAGSAWEEAFCDEFARRLLVPPPVGHLAADDLVHLHARYDVSVEVAARSLASAPTRPRVAIWWWTADSCATVQQQWSTDGDFARELGVDPRRVCPEVLPGILEAARERLGVTLTSAVLPARRQAIAVRAGGSE